MNNSSINLKSKEEIKKNFDNSKKLRVSQPEMKKKKNLQTNI